MYLHCSVSKGAGTASLIKISVVKQLQLRFYFSMMANAVHKSIMVAGKATVAEPGAGSGVVVGSSLGDEGSDVVVVVVVVVVSWLSAIAIISATLSLPHWIFALAEAIALLPAMTARGYSTSIEASIVEYSAKPVSSK